VKLRKSPGEANLDRLRKSLTDAQRLRDERAAAVAAAKLAAKREESKLISDLVQGGIDVAAYEAGKAKAAASATEADRLLALAAETVTALEAEGKRLAEAVGGARVQAAEDRLEERRRELARLEGEVAKAGASVVEGEKSLAGARDDADRLVGEFDPEVRLALLNRERTRREHLRHAVRAGPSMAHALGLDWAEVEAERERMNREAAARAKKSRKLVSRIYAPVPAEDEPGFGRPFPLLPAGAPLRSGEVRAVDFDAEE